MSEEAPEFNKLAQPSEPRTIDTEEKAILGSGQSHGTEPSENFIAPTMALDALEPDSDD